MKHKTHWLLYTSVLKYWTTDFLFYKKQAKFQFLISIFTHNYTVYNFYTLKTKLGTDPFNLPLVFCFFKRYNNLLNRGAFNPSLFTRFQVIAFSQTFIKPLMSFLPILLHDHSVAYTSSTVLGDKSTDGVLPVSLISRIILHQELEFYKIIILLILNQIQVY